MSFTRRDLGSLTAALLALGLEPPDAIAQTVDTSTGHDMSGFPPSWYGAEKIAFVAYPGFTSLDLVGPHHMLGSLLGASVFIVAKSRDPVISEPKLTFVPDYTFETCPADLDIICVPGGGMGTLAAMQDDATSRFLKYRGGSAKLVTSVCTGALLLGAAGLLDGYKATSHWATREVLRVFGAIPIEARVVRDRNRVTGGGVTAGLDFGLALVAALRDATYAQSVQLLAEYAPDPPFDAGTPAHAPAEVTAMVRSMFAGYTETATKLGQAAFARAKQL